MADNNTLYLHAGLHRTGSTTLQSFFAANRDTLRRLGIVYPRLSLHEHHCSLVGSWHIDDGGEAHAEWGRGWKEIQDLLHRSEHPILLSCENFFLLLIQHGGPQKMLEVLGNNAIKIIIYLRRQDLHLESWYSYTVQNLHETEGIFDSEAYAMARHVHNYHALLNRLAESFGPESLIVRVFEPGSFSGGSLCHDFISAMGLEWSDDFAPPPKRANKSIDPRLHELCRAAAKRFDDQNIAQSFVQMSRSLSDRLPSKSMVIMPLDKREAYLDSFNESNAKVAKSFFHREQLFNDDIPEGTPIDMDDETCVCQDTTLSLHELWHKSMRGMGLYDYNNVLMQRLSAEEGSTVWKSIRLTLHKLFHKTRRLVPR